MVSQLPACKSTLQRVLLAGFVSHEPCVAECGEQPLAEDPLVFLAALERLGAEVTRTRGRIAWHAREKPRAARLELAENGTALRFLTAALAVAGGRFEVRGRTGLARRPVDSLVDCLTPHGVEFGFAETVGRVPFVLASPGLAAGVELRIPVASGTQAASGLLLGLAGGGGGRLVLTDAERVPGYVELTLDVLRRFGVACAVAPRASTVAITVPGGELHAPDALTIPVDASAATWVLAFAAASGRELSVPYDPSWPHPDESFVAHLRALGHEVSETEDVRRVRGRPGASDYRFDELGTAPDSFPPLVVALATRGGVHELSGAAKLRDKESDRIAVLAAGLAKIGFEVDELPDGLRLRGRPPSSFTPPAHVRFECAGDHRMAMAFSLLAAVYGFEAELSEPECVDKSWPGFHAWLASAAQSPAP